MKTVRAVNRTRDAVVAERATVADSFLRRGWGLLGHAALAHNEGMIITNTNCIHSLFMRFRFDAIFVDANGVVCALLKDFRPFRFGPLVWRAKHVIELPAGAISRSETALGDVIVWGSENHPLGAV